MNKTLQRSFLLALTALISTPIALLGSDDRRILRNNYELIYLKSPPQTKHVWGILTEGLFYNRLRSNSFMYNWEAEITGKQENHVVSGLGGSMIFKSGVYHDFSLTTGLYYSQGFIGDSTLERLKSGKDILSRFDASNGRGDALAVMGEAYLAYTGLKSTRIQLGSQIVSSFYVKPNDSKMIPNTFDGLVIRNKSFKDTKFFFAYLGQQKLRDHSLFHSVIAVADSTSTSENNPQYYENDDSARHKGLTVSALNAAGVAIDTPLITAEIKHKINKNFRIDLSSYALPKLLSQVKMEARYRLKKTKDYSVVTSARYIKQMDNGAGFIGGASIDGDINTFNSGGYKNPNSLESQMLAFKVVTRYKNLLLNLAYTDIFDEADLVTPWRGFPTGGYTRSMARYNWEANTKSYRILLKINPSIHRMKNHTYIETSYLHTNADESKGEFDEDYYYLGFVHSVKSVQGLQWRLRLGYADTKNPNADSLDGRFEINYLFDFPKFSLGRIYM